MRVSRHNMDKFVIRKRKSDDDKDSQTGGKVRKVVEEVAEDFDAKSIVNKTIDWREIRGENLNCDYCLLFKTSDANVLLSKCEEYLSYNEGQLAKVYVFGKWHDIPRKQVAYGNAGLSYSFSNTTVPARPWTPFLASIRDAISQATGYTFNFVLINRYKDGSDHIGEHRDDEADLVKGHPIASLSLGQSRDFVFKHGDSRGKNAKRKIKPVEVLLEHGSLLMMKYPTNTYWYHSLPQRKRLSNVRINMTFRKMVPIALRITCAILFWGMLLNSNSRGPKMFVRPP